MSYTVSEPHPDFGKDPNIANELGHTKYPKWIDHPTEKRSHPVMPNKQVPVSVLVENEEQEKELLGEAKNETKPNPKGWSKVNDNS